VHNHFNIIINSEVADIFKFLLFLVARKNHQKFKK
jgi:hypothetical protein